MADEPEKTTPARSKQPYAWPVLILLALGAGALYLSQIAPDSPPQKTAALPVPPAVAPVPQPGSAMQTPGFDAVTADESGMLVVAGKAEPGSTVIVQNGTGTVGETKADANGDWVITPEKPLPPGAYSLSLLSIEPKTKASRRSAKSFALTVAPRAPKVAKAPPPAGTQPGSLNAATTPPGPAAAVTAKQVASAAPTAQAATPEPRKTAAVKRGDTLWKLARRYYGNGLRYGKIAEANKDRIKSPDLIYPKQQLNIPR